MRWSSLSLRKRTGPALALAAVLACAPSDSGEGDRRFSATGDDATPHGLRGRVLPGPLTKPDVTLTDTRGQPFDLRRETDGHLTLLFFGYTFCPDICPIHMANLAAVLRELRPAVAQRVKVVFVTTDPDRDTPERLGTWLANFDRSFIGLTGDTATVNAAQRALYLPLPQIGPADSAGGYLVGHAAAVVAFSPDGAARVMYPFGIRQADWAHDIPKLLEASWDD
ncbi:MAG TPA: SCO family protein [Gemmatimonadales bacterium]